MKRFALFLTALSLALGGIAFAKGWLQVKPDKQNVVASRLVGSWAIDPDTTKRLQGKVRGPKAVEFTNDPGALDALSEAKFGKHFSARQAYLVGKMKFDGREVPYLLTSLHGNPHVFFFRPRGGDPLGDSESFNVMLARGATPAQDMLFLGGDFNNTPFLAFKRAGAPAGKAPKADLSTPEGVVNAWIAAVKARDKDAALALGSPAWKAEELKWKRSFTHAIFDLGWKLVSCEVRTPTVEGKTASVSCRAVFINDKGKEDPEGLRFKLQKLGDGWKIVQLH